MFALPSWLRGRDSVELYIGDSCRYNPSTFYTRPEDRILTIFVEEVSEEYGLQYHHVTMAIVFISTLLHLSKSRRFIGWHEWKQYAWVADHRKADDLFQLGVITSSSRIINFSPQVQPGVTTLEVTAFRPSKVEWQLYLSGDASDNSRDGGPHRLVGRMASLDVQVEEGAEVLMTEDNIILIEARYLPDNSFLILTSWRSRIKGLTQLPK